MAKTKAKKKAENNKNNKNKKSDADNDADALIIERKTDFLIALFIGSLILANTLGIKVISIFGIRVSVGIFFVPILFLVTDIITEIHGKKRAQNLVFASIIILIMTAIMMYICVIITPNEAWTNQEAYKAIFGSTIRMTIASLIAFTLSQFHDVWSFEFWRKKTKGKLLWVRNNASTVVSQLIDTIVFMFIAFYKIAPKFTVPFIISLIIPYWLFKVAFAIIDTPFCYLGVKWLRGNKK